MALWVRAQALYGLGLGLWRVDGQAREAGYNEFSVTGAQQKSKSLKD